MTWHPPLSDGSAARAYAVVEHLSRRLSVDHFAAETPGLASGSAGLALFLSYLAQEQESAALAERAAAAFDHALEPVVGMPDAAESASILSGFPGLAWLVQHRPPLGGGRAEAWLSGVDRAVVGCLQTERWLAPFYYGEGLIGLGTYLLERPASALVEQGIGQIVRHLERLAVREGAGVAWLRPAESFPEAVRPAADVFDLGIPRGVGGAIAFLTGASRIAGARDRALALLRRAVDWLLEQGRDEPRGRFGSYRLPGAPAPAPTRLAWCYGDLGLSLILWGAARTLKDAALGAFCRDLAHRSTARGPEDSTTEIEDAGFCHGAAGAGHLYARLFEATGEEAFRASSQRWFESALARFREGEGLGGFEAFYARDGDPVFRRQRVPGLMLGSAGIGLCLLSACRPVPPDWDRYFLIGLDRAA